MNGQMRAPYIFGGIPSPPKLESVVKNPVTGYQTSIVQCTPNIPPSRPFVGAENQRHPNNHLICQGKTHVR